MAKGPKEKPTGHPQNDIATKAQPFLERIERLEDEKDVFKADCRERCKELSGEQKSVYEEAEGAGVNKAALKGIVKRRKLQKKVDAIDDDFDMDEASQFAAFMTAFGGTPFGSWAADVTARTAEVLQARGLKVSVQPAAAREERDDLAQHAGNSQ
jgi:uncharacterized protein (UPF0335 family)